jgi:hypothetical protein
MTDISIGLESIGDNKRDKLWHHRNRNVRMGSQEAAGAMGLLGDRPFVKRLVCIDAAGNITKSALRGKKCYQDSSGTGARGVYYWYQLKEGLCYQIQRQVSWARTERIFVYAHNSSLIEISEDQARRWLLAVTKADKAASQTTRAARKQEEY